MHESPDLSTWPRDSERRLLEFDQAWQHGSAPSVNDFLPTSGELVSRRELLKELIKIDLEYRWRRGAGRGPLLEEYAAQHPELGPAAALPLDLIAAEYEARLSWGDRPAVQDYAARFPAHGEALCRQLRQVEASLAEERSDATRVLTAPPPVSNPVLTDGAAPSLPALIEEMARLQLLPGERCRALESEFADALACTRELVRRGTLTPFQANQLMLGLGGDLRLGPYLLLDYLGEGATGRVYKARDSREDRIIALKVIRKELLTAPEVVARFQREVHLATRLDHPNLVHALDADPVGPSLILAMEFVEGTDLSRLVKERGPLPVSQACEYIRQAALGLQHAHERRLVHRDVKPSNLMLTTDGTVKVLDLGLARFHRSLDEETAHTLMEISGAGTMTPLGAVMMGTPDYMAPEQALDFHKADVRADVYSLGCTLFFLLTGLAAFAGSTLTAKLLQHQQAEPPPLGQFRNDVPEPVAALLRRMLAKTPEQRPQTPGEVAAALEAIADGAPQRPRRSSPGRVAVFVGLVALTVALAFVAFQAPRQTAPHEPALRALLHDLEVRAANPGNDVGELRRDLLTFRATYPGTAEALAATTLLMRLPSALDGLSPSIPDTERFADAPEDLLAVLGERRFRHRGSVEVVAFGPDGQTVFTGGSGDGFIHIWDVDRRTELTPLRMLPGQVPCLAFSPDGCMIASGGENHVRLWDAVELREVSGLRNHTAAVQRVAWSPDSTLLASASGDKTIKLWDVATGQERQTFRGPQHAATALAFAPHERILVSSHDRAVKVWDIVTGKERTTAARGSSAVHALAFTPDGRLLAAGGDDGKVMLWDTASWKVRRELKHNSPLRSLAFTPDGQALASGGRDGAIKLWEVPSGREVRTLTGHVSTVQSLEFRRDGRLLASGGQDGTLRLWDPAAGAEVVPGHGHAGVVQALMFAPDGSALATAGADQTVRLWDPATAKEKDVLQGHTGAVYAVAYDALGRSLASVSGDGTVRLWDASGGKSRNVVQLRAGGLIAAAFAPDGRTLACGCQTGPVKLLEAGTLRERSTLAGPRQTLNGLAFAPDGGTLTTGSEDGVVKLWSIRSGQETASFPSRAMRRVRAVAWAPDGKLVAAANGDGSVSLWDPAVSREKTALAGHASEVYSLAFRPDGKLLVTGGADGRVVFWDPASGTKVQEWLLPAAVQGIAYAPDGRHLATANSHGAVYLFRGPRP